MNKEINRALRLPIIDPFLMILRKRSVIGPLAILLVGLLVMQFPVLEPYAEQVLQVTVMAMAALFAGQQAQDLIEKSKMDPLVFVEPNVALEQLVAAFGQEAVRIALAGVEKPPQGDQ